MDQAVSIIPETHAFTRLRIASCTVYAHLNREGETEQHNFVHLPKFFSSCR